MKKAGERKAGERAGEGLGLADGLVQLSFLVQATLGAVAAEEELSIVQVRLLGILRDREPGMLELAEHLELDKSSVTGLIDRAERRGLVKRVPHAQDGRGVRVRLTERGRKLAEAGEARIAREVEALAETLSKAEREQLAALAGKVAASGLAARARR